MSLALKLLDVAPSDSPAHLPYRLADSELRLRSQFVAAFTDAPQSAWEMHTAVWDLTDELKSKGELAEGVVIPSPGISQTGLEGVEIWRFPIGE